jgi:hypothetical protein
VTTEIEGLLSEAMAARDSMVLFGSDVAAQKYEEAREALLSAIRALAASPAPAQRSAPPGCGDPCPQGDAACPACRAAPAQRDATRAKDLTSHASAPGEPSPTKGADAGCDEQERES